MIITDITDKSCSVLTIVNEINHRKAYTNSIEGRTEFQAECAEAENYDEVIAAWRTEPTVLEETFDETEPTEVQETLETRVSNLEETVDTMLTGGGT